MRGNAGGKVSALAAKCNSVSVGVSQSFSGLSNRFLIVSAPDDPPGSRVAILGMFAVSRAVFKSFIWVDFPAPTALKGNELALSIRLRRAPDNMFDCRADAAKETELSYIGTRHKGVLTFAGARHVYD